MESPERNEPRDETALLDADQRRVLTALLAMQRRSWEQGVLSHAALDLGLDELAAVIAHDAVVQRTAAGKLAEVDDASVANTGALVEVAAWASSRADDEDGSRGVAHASSSAPADDERAASRTALADVVTWLVERAPRAADGTLFHLENLREVWVDTVYMLVPALVVAGRPDEARRQLAGHRARLRDDATGLWAARWDEDRATLVRADHWGTGNGWVAAGLARAVHHLGGRDDELPGAVDDARAVIGACLAHRREDGTFGDTVDGPSSFAEVNLAQMLAYAVATGVADGWLPAADGLVARELVATARAHVDPLGLVRPVAGAPHFDRPGTSAEAQAFFLLATAATHRLP